MQERRFALVAALALGVCTGGGRGGGTRTSPPAHARKTPPRGPIRGPRDGSQPGPETRRLERALFGALELRDPSTAGHGLRTGGLAAILAPALGVDPEVARRAGTLHDLGKIGMPDSILRGTKKGLSDAEYAIVKLHPVHGRRLAKTAGLAAPVAAAIAHHHERFDGGGYPDGLAGEEIPAVARVVAVADVLDAVTARRSYKPARPFAAGMAAIEGAAGGKLDPRVVGYAGEVAKALEGRVTAWQAAARETDRRSVRGAGAGRDPPPGALHRPPGP